MKALIMRDDAEAAAGCAKALLDKGFQVACVESRHIAQALLRIEPVDLLVMDERVGGRLTHALALSAERRHPYISAILMTDRPGEDTDELYELIPSLYALAGISVAPEILAQLALSSIEDFAQAEARVGRLTAADLAEAALGPGPDIEDELADWEDDLVDEIVLITDDASAFGGPDIPLYSDVAQSHPALAEELPEEEEILDPAMADKADLPHFATLGTPDAKSVVHIARLSSITEARSAV